MFISKCSFNPIRRLRFTQGDRQETGSVRSRPRWHGTGSQRRRLQAQETSMYLNLNFCFYWFTHHFWSLTLLNQPRCSPLKKASSTRFVSILLCSAKLSMALNTFRRHTDSAFQVIELHLTHTLKCASVVLRKYIIYLLCTAERGWNIDSSLVLFFFFNNDYSLMGLILLTWTNTTTRRNYKRKEPGKRYSSNRSTRQQSFYNHFCSIKSHFCVNNHLFLAIVSDC